MIRWSMRPTGESGKFTVVASNPETAAHSLRLSLKGISVDSLALYRTSAEEDCAELARLYQETISTLGKRIQVSGDPQRLQQEETAEQIRALLLAGVRFAWLWQQRGGRRWHLLLRRGRLLENLQALEHIL